MRFSCLSWVLVIYHEVFSPFIRSPQPPSEPLPNDIIADILSRLPGECVQQCRRVCKEWKSLISTSYFIEMHLKHATPSVVVHKRSFKGEDVLFFIDELGGMNMTRNPRTRKVSSDSTLLYLRDHAHLEFSYNGLIVFEPRIHAPDARAGVGMGMIFNPFTRDKIVLRNFFGKILALFFHPIAREYRMLWSASQGEHVEFRIISLHSGSRWRRLSSNFTSKPLSDLPPVNLTIFSILKEEFHVMPHPGHAPGDGSECKHLRMQLTNINGNLSICDFWKFSGTLDIWILEDYSNWLWTKRHSINLELDVLSKQLPDYKRFFRVRPLGMQNGALLLNFYGHGVFSYHLQQKTIKKFIFDRNNVFCYVVSLHIKSHVTLKNCASYINFSDN